MSQRALQVNVQRNETLWMIFKRHNLWFRFRLSDNGPHDTAEHTFATFCMPTWDVTDQQSTCSHRSSSKCDFFLFFFFLNVKYKLLICVLVNSVDSDIHPMRTFWKSTNHVHMQKQDSVSSGDFRASDATFKGHLNKLMKFIFFKASCGGFYYKVLHTLRHLKHK